MSELRVDNIVSQDGSAAPIYSKGLNIGAGQTLTNAGDYTVSGTSTFNGASSFSGVTVAGVTTVSNTLNVTGATNVTGALNVTGGGNFNNPSGIITCGTLDVSGSTAFGDITGTIGTLIVSNDGTVGGGLTISGNAVIEGNLTVTGTTSTIDTTVTAVDTLAVDGEITTGGKPVAATGKAIAMAMVFGG